MTFNCVTFLFKVHVKMIQVFDALVSVTRQRKKTLKLFLFVYRETRQGLSLGQKRNPQNLQTSSHCTADEEERTAAPTLRSTVSDTAQPEQSTCSN